MGEAPEVRGFFLGCGFNSAGKRDLKGSYPAGMGSQVHPGLVCIPPCSPGMMLGGGCGRELAHWIIHGRPEKDMYGYDIR